MKGERVVDAKELFAPQESDSDEWDWCQMSDAYGKRTSTSSIIIDTISRAR